MKPPPLIPNPRIPYAEVASRLAQISWGKLTTLGKVSDHPLFVWQHTPPGSIAGQVLLSGGIHGDEPSGVECLLGLLESRPAWLNHFEIVIFPCLNPWGYEHNNRLNKEGRDLNRLWRSHDSPEVALCLDVLKKNRFDLTLCLHEDYDALGFYMYEISRSGQTFGEPMVQSVARVMPIEGRQRIEGRTAANGIVMRTGGKFLRRKHWPEAIHHYQHHTDHTITTETPSCLSIARRVRAQTEAIRIAFKMLLRNP